MRLTDADRARFKGQCARLLAALAERPLTNVEIAALGILKYTSRISDLRAAGYVIDCERVGDGGLTVYYLRGWFDPDAPQMRLAL